MPFDRLTSTLLGSFAAVLEYPEPGLREAVRECEALAAERSPQAAALLSEFGTIVERESLGRLQELYTGAFDLDTLSDLDATCYPYVGHHLFGESYKRSTFLIELIDRFRGYGFTVERELPDHLLVVLRFVAAHPDTELAEEIVDEALVPALRRMVGEDEGALEPRSGRLIYQSLLRALLLVLEEPSRSAPSLVSAGEAT